MLNQYWQFRRSHFGVLKGPRRQVAVALSGSRNKDTILDPNTLGKKW